MNSPAADNNASDVNDDDLTFALPQDDSSFEQFIPRLTWITGMQSLGLGPRNPEDIPSLAKPCVCDSCIFNRHMRIPSLKNYTKDITFNSLLQTDKYKHIVLGNYPLCEEVMHIWDNDDKEQMPGRRSKKYKIGKLKDGGAGAEDEDDGKPYHKTGKLKDGGAGAGSDDSNSSSSEGEGGSESDVEDEDDGIYPGKPFDEDDIPANVIPLKDNSSLGRKTSGGTMTLVHQYSSSEGGLQFLKGMVELLENKFLDNDMPDRNQPVIDLIEGLERDGYEFWRVMKSGKKIIYTNIKHTLDEKKSIRDDKDSTRTKIYQKIRSLNDKSTNGIIKDINNKLAEQNKEKNMAASIEENQNKLGTLNRDAERIFYNIISGEYNNIEEQNKCMNDALGVSEKEIKLAMARQLEIDKEKEKELKVCID